MAGGRERGWGGNKGRQCQDGELETPWKRKASRVQWGTTLVEMHREGGSRTYRDHLRSSDGGTHSPKSF